MLPAPAGHSPVRRPHSVRRTATLDITWRDGRDGERLLSGVARDIYTGASAQPPIIIAIDRLWAAIAADRRIEAIHADPCRRALHALVNMRASGALRAALAEIARVDLFEHSPLYLMIDDLVGANLVADWAWSRWLSHTPELRQRRKNLLDSMAGVCIGFTEGANSLRSSGDYQERNAAQVESLVHPKDPDGWHSLPEIGVVSLRRARRMDIWIDGDVIVDAGFQDSATNPDGSRTAVHEYTLRAAIDPLTWTLKELLAFPRILPFPECPAAVDNLAMLIGAPVLELRSLVGRRLASVLGCTHLNDVVRALADVPQLARTLAKFPFRP